MYIKASSDDDKYTVTANNPGKKLQLKKAHLKIFHSVKGS